MGLPVLYRWAESQREEAKSVFQRRKVGLRTAEVLRLEWSDVDLVRGFVTVAAHKSKTARRRLIPIAQNLAEWVRCGYAGLCTLPSAIWV